MAAEPTSLVFDAKYNKINDHDARNNDEKEVVAPKMVIPLKKERFRLLRLKRIG